MSDTQPQEIDHVVTEEDIAENPGIEEHVEVGDTVTIPAEDEGEEAPAV